MKTQQELIRMFDAAQTRLAAHGVTVKSDGTFFLVDASGAVLSKPETVDGLTSFADALDFIAKQRFEAQR